MQVHKVPSKIQIGAVATVYLFVFVQLALAQPAGMSSTAELIRVMTDPERDWEERHRAEERLHSRPSAEVLEALLPHAERGMPGATVWNSRGPIHDREGTVVWQIHYAVARTWGLHVRLLGAESAGPVLSTLLGRTRAGPAQVRILEGLFRHWTPAAESPVARLAAGSPQSEVRLAAARCLLFHSRSDHIEELVDVAEEEEETRDRRLWFDVLTDPQWTASAEANPRVVAMGFALLEEDLHRTGDASGSAVALADRLAAYQGIDFGTGNVLPGVDSDDEASRNAVWRALEWWAAHQGRIREEIRARSSGRDGGS